MKRSIVPRLVALACLIVLAPLLPFWFLRCAGSAVADLMDFCVEGRAWVQPFGNACEWIELRFLTREEMLAKYADDDDEDIDE